MHWHVLTHTRGSTCAFPHSPAPHGARRSARRGQHRRRVVAFSTDYKANENDGGVLRLPLKQELDEEQLKEVFGYDRDLHGRCDASAAAFGLPKRQFFVTGWCLLGGQLRGRRRDQATCTWP